jgi:hypothetical protein
MDFVYNYVTQKRHIKNICVGESFFFIFFHYLYSLPEEAANVSKTTPFSAISDTNYVPTMHRNERNSFLILVPSLLKNS